MVQLLVGLICKARPSTDFGRIVFRALQGIGGSGLYTMAQICILEICPKSPPAMIGLMIGGTLSVSFVLGPVLGGAIAGTTHWTWIFNIK